MRTIEKRGGGKNLSDEGPTFETSRFEFLHSEHYLTNSVDKFKSKVLCFTSPPM